jgi:hypothetical protein
MENGSQACGGLNCLFSSLKGVLSSFGESVALNHRGIISKLIMKIFTYVFRTIFFKTFYWVKHLNIIGQETCLSME